MILNLAGEMLLAYLTVLGLVLSDNSSTATSYMECLEFFDHRVRLTANNSRNIKHKETPRQDGRSYRMIEALEEHLWATNDLR